MRRKEPDDLKAFQAKLKIQTLTGPSLTWKERYAECADECRDLQAQNKALAACLREFIQDYQEGGRFDPGAVRDAQALLAKMEKETQP
jgi:hypothetical protein